METEQIVYVDPARVLTDDNTRFTLKDTATDTLMESILERGGVMEPCEVEPLEGDKAHDYRLTSGFYRHGATVRLNKEQSAGLSLPVIVRAVGDAKERLKRQVSENTVRENMSPMDTAVAIKKLMDVGVTKVEIRKILAKPGGKRGNSMEMLSNATINIYLNLLELPKNIQEKIHDGRVGLAGAYQLGRVSPDKRQVVLERAEADRQAQLELESKDEQKYLEAEAKVKKVEDESKAALSEIELTKLAVDEAAVLVKEKIQVVKELSKTSIAELEDEKQKKAFTEKFNSAKADVKGAEKTLKETQNKLAKLHTTKDTLEEKVTKARESLDAARKAAKGSKKKSKGLRADDIKGAAAKEGQTTGYVPLSASDTRSLVKDLQKDSNAGPKVREIGAAFARALSGETTTKELIGELGVIVGEVKASAVKAPVAGQKVAKAK